MIQPEKNIKNSRRMNRPEIYSFPKQGPSVGASDRLNRNFPRLRSQQNPEEILNPNRGSSGFSFY